MRSTGEVMGIADSFGMAFAKAQTRRTARCPLRGRFHHGERSRQGTVVPIARRFHALGFKVLRDPGHRALSPRGRGIPAERVLKVYEGRPNAIDLLVSGQIQLLINTPLGKLTQQDDYTIRRAALQHRVAVHHDHVGGFGGLRRHHRAAEPGRRGRRSRSGTRWPGKCP